MVRALAALAEDLGLCSQHPCGDSQFPVTASSGDLMPPLTTIGTTCTHKNKVTEEEEVLSDDLCREIISVKADGVEVCTRMGGKGVPLGAAWEIYRASVQMGETQERNV